MQLTVFQPLSLSTVAAEVGMSSDLTASTSVAVEIGKKNVIRVTAPVPRAVSQDDLDLHVNIVSYFALLWRKRTL